MGNGDPTYIEPPIKYVEDKRRNGLADDPINFRPETEPRDPKLGVRSTYGDGRKRVEERDPVALATHYVNHQWVQQLVPVRTECLICHKQSDLVHLPIGTMCFGNLRMLRRGNSHNRDRDITKETIDAFAAIGWKFGLRRSYCPDCKGLGSV